MAAVLAAAAILVGCGGGVGVATGSALVEPPPHGWSIAVEVDEPFTDGLEVLMIADGQGSVEVERVEVLGTDALSVVGFYVAGPERTFGAVQFFNAFPPSEDTDLERQSRLAELEPISTEAPFIVADHELGTELLLGLRATQPGRHERTGIRIFYSRDGVSYQQDLFAELVVCAKAKLAADDRCELDTPQT